MSVLLLRQGTVFDNYLHRSSDSGCLKGKCRPHFLSLLRKKRQAETGEDTAF